MAQVFVIFMEYGEYSDYTAQIVSAHSTKEVAEERAAELKRRYDGCKADLKTLDKRDLRGTNFYVECQRVLTRWGFGDIFPHDTPTYTVQPLDLDSPLAALLPIEEVKL